MAKVTSMIIYLPRNISNQYKQTADTNNGQCNIRILCNSANETDEKGTNICEWRYNSWFHDMNKIINVINAPYSDNYSFLSIHFISIFPYYVHCLNVNHCTLLCFEVESDSVLFKSSSQFLYAFPIPKPAPRNIGQLLPTKNRIFKINDTSKSHNGN